MIVTVTLNPAIDRIVDAPGFRAGRTLASRVVAVVPAGKGVNVSRYLSALGVPSVAAGFVGESDRALYEKSFAGTRITSALVPVNAPTRVNMTIRGGPGRPETHLREEGFAVGARSRRTLKLVLARLARKGNTFVLSGSLPKGFSPAEFARLLGSLRRAGATVVVDASGPALAAAARAGADVLSPNEAELRELRTPPARLLKRVGVVALKRGEKGGRLITRDSSWSAAAPVPKARVRNTVGAGDAFLAGFLAARVCGLPEPGCLCVAVAAGASAVTAGVVGRLDRRAFERALRRARVAPCASRG